MPYSTCANFRDILKSMKTRLAEMENTFDHLSMHHDGSIEKLENKVAAMQIDLGSLLQSIQDCEEKGYK